MYGRFHAWSPWSCPGSSLNNNCLCFIVVPNRLFFSTKAATVQCVPNIKNISACVMAIWPETFNDESTKWDACREHVRS